MIIFSQRYCLGNRNCQKKQVLVILFKDKCQRPLKVLLAMSELGPLLILLDFRNASIHFDICCHCSDVPFHSEKKKEDPTFLYSPKTKIGVLKLLIYRNMQFQNRPRLAPVSSQRLLQHFTGEHSGQKYPDQIAANKPLPAQKHRTVMGNSTMDSEIMRG